MKICVYVYPNKLYSYFIYKYHDIYKTMNIYIHRIYTTYIHPAFVNLWTTPHTHRSTLKYMHTNLHKTHTHTVICYTSSTYTHTHTHTAICYSLSIGWLAINFLSFSIPLTSLQNTCMRIYTHTHTHSHMLQLIYRLTCNQFPFFFHIFDQHP